MTKQLLFSVVSSDCDWSYTRGTGPGGQKRNKTSSAVHCTHRASGAYAFSDKTRSQHDNKRDAFIKMINTDKFKVWHRLETMRRMGTLQQIEDHVEHELAVNVKVEVKEDGKWVEKKII
jgi:protein subunit release factor B